MVIRVTVHSWTACSGLQRCGAWQRWLQGRAASLKKSPDITESALRRALAELERSVQDTKRESRATDTRVAQLEQGRLRLAEQVADANTRCAGGQCLAYVGCPRRGRKQSAGWKAKGLQTRSRQLY